ncbi:unnamed protein product [Sphagnum jensenii]|uniref:Uncharacterized protein n=1 Tax=Sphagnum jensenii TaxID=128206 RepID=A0ABP1BIX0_9BRYO
MMPESVLSIQLTTGGSLPGYLISVENGSDEGTREDEGSGKEGKRRRAPSNLGLKHVRIPHSSPSHRMNLRKRPRDECASSEDDRKLSESVDVSVRNVAYFHVTDVRKNDSYPRRNG